MPEATGCGSRYVLAQRGEPLAADTGVIVLNGPGGPVLKLVGKVDEAVNAPGEVGMSDGVGGALPRGGFLRSCLSNETLEVCRP